MPDDAALQDVEPQDAEPEGVPVAHSEQSEQGIQPVDASEQSEAAESAVPSRSRRFKDALLNPKAWFAPKNRPGIAAFVIPATDHFHRVSGVGGVAQRQPAHPHYRPVPSVRAVPR